MMSDVPTEVSLTGKFPCRKVPTAADEAVSVHDLQRCSKGVECQVPAAGR